MKNRRIEGRKAPEQERSKNKEIAELKRENHKLKRELSRLRKQVGYLLDVQDNWSGPEESPAVSNTGGRGSTPSCDSCGGPNLVTLDLPIGALVVCRDCKHKKRRLKCPM